MTHFVRTIIVYILLPTSVFSQQPDSIKPKIFENFFGSDCVYSITCDLEKKDFCILNRTENIVYREKKGKLIWSIDLKEEFDSAETIGDCISSWSSKRGASATLLKGQSKIIVFVLVANETWVLTLNLRSGRVVKKHCSSNRNAHNNG